MIYFLNLFDNLKMYIITNQNHFINIFLLLVLYSNCKNFITSLDIWPFHKWFFLCLSSFVHEYACVEWNDSWHPSDILQINYTIRTTWVLGMPYLSYICIFTGTRKVFCEIFASTIWSKVTKMPTETNKVTPSPCKKMWTSQRST